jgi:TolA-binding protein
MKKSLLTVLILSENLFLIGCADDQARAQIADLNNRISEMQGNITNVDSKVTGQKSLDIINKMNNMQDQIDQINGSISTIKNNQKTFEDTQKQVNQGLQQQISGGSAAAVTTKSASSDVVKSTKNVSTSSNDDKAELKLAFDEIKSHDFEKAITKLKSVLGNSHNSDTLATARYYLSVAYAASGSYMNAIANARTYLKDYPDGRDAPNAMRTVYISQLQLKMPKSAARTAKELIKKFPDSDAAKKVKQQN